MATWREAKSAELPDVHYQDIVENLFKFTNALSNFSWADPENSFRGSLQVFLSFFFSYQHLSQMAKRTSFNKQSDLTKSEH